MQVGRKRQENQEIAALIGGTGLYYCAWASYYAFRNRFPVVYGNSGRERGIPGLQTTVRGIQ